MSLDKQAVGTLALRAVLVGTPELGMIVDEVEVVHDSTGQTQLLECLRETAFTLHFFAPPVPIFESVGITLDMQQGTITVGPQFDSDALARLLDE